MSEEQIRLIREIIRLEIRAYIRGLESDEIWRIGDEIDDAIRELTEKK